MKASKKNTNRNLLDKQRKNGSHSFVSRLFFIPILLFFVIVQFWYHWCALANVKALFATYLFFFIHTDRYRQCSNQFQSFTNCYLSQRNYWNDEKKCSWLFFLSPWLQTYKRGKKSNGRSAHTELLSRILDWPKINKTHKFFYWWLLFQYISSVFYSLHRMASSR